MKKNILVMLLLSVLPIFAQGGSVYSRFGIGDLSTSFTARRLALGELGIALSDKDYLNVLNPAGWNEMRLTRFELSLIYSGNQLKNSSSSVYHTDTHFNGLMFGFPIKQDLGISIAMGLVPYSKVRYEIDQTVQDPLVGDYSLNNKGDGGLSRFFIGGSYRLPLDFSFGISYDYYYGRIENSIIADFASTGSYENASFIKETNYHGMGYTAGLISGDIAKLIGSKIIKDFKIGLVYTPSVTLSTDSVDNSSTQLGTIITSTGSIKTNLPYKLGVGTTFKYDDNYTFILDYLYQPFSLFTANGNKNENLQDYYKVGLGFEYRNANVRSNDYWDYAMFRAGISYERTPYKISGTSINQFSIYGGMSLPLSYDNTIDFAFQYGRRGTIDNNLLLENLFKFTVSISIGELWFMPTDR